MKNKRSKIKNTRWKIVDSMFLSLMITGSVIEFSHVGAGFIDGLIISRFLGSEAMAAEGIAHPLFSILGVLSGIIAVGMQVKCSKLVGRGDVQEVNRFFSTSVYVGIAISIITTIIIMAFSDYVAMFFGASGNAKELVGPASSYLRGIGFGTPAIILTAILGPALQLDSGRKIIERGALIEGASDIILDLVAVKMGWGMSGIGYATSIACYLNLLFVCTHFLKKDRLLHFVKANVSIGEFFSMLSNGLEKALRRLTNVVRPIILNTVIISYGGTMAMSALSVRNNFSNFTEIFAIGIASALSLLVGLYYGEINEEAIKEVKKCEWRYALVFSSAICLILLIFAREIAGLYIVDNDEVKDMVVFALRMLALQGPLQVLVKGRVSYLQVINKKVNMTVFIFLSQLIFVIIAAILLGRAFGVYGILACYTVSDACSLIALYVYYQFTKKKIVLEIDDLLVLPDHFYLGPGDVISLDIRDMDDVSLAAQQIQLFCKGHRYDEKTGYYAALAFEELANNIVQHGFPKNKKKDPIIDFRLVATNDKLVLRLRDDCPHFDITKFIASIREDEDEFAHIGLKIACKAAENMEYTHAFETNNIIITYDV